MLNAEGRIKEKLENARKVCVCVRVCVWRTWAKGRGGLPKGGVGSECVSLEGGTEGRKEGGRLSER